MLLLGDSTNLLKDFNDSSVDLIVTDPPYGIEFMGKDWDKALVSTETWKECYRVLKEGKLAFIMCSPRQDVLSRMIVNLQDAGFRTNYTSIYWTYASGFPKAANISKLIDKKAGAEREIIGKYQYPTDQPKRKQLHGGGKTNNAYGDYEGLDGDSNITKAATEEAKKMEGAYIGFQPKPAVEVILVVSKGKTLTWLDDCRIPYQTSQDYLFQAEKNRGPKHIREGWGFVVNGEVNEKGRFPANLLVSDDVLNDGKITKGNGHFPNRTDPNKFSGYKPIEQSESYLKDSGSYSRYFSLDAWTRTFPFLIVPKASRSERNKGLEGLPFKQKQGIAINSPDPTGKFPEHDCRVVGANNHPTVKPLKLMSYLIIMGSREGDLILDPFIGSGTTVIAAEQLHRRWIGIDLNKEYIEIAQKRLLPYLSQTKLLTIETA